MTPALRALSADGALLRRFRDGAVVGRVHSVFTRVFNVAVEDGGLVTLASREVDDAPDTIVLDAPDFRESGIEVGDRVTASGTSIVIERWRERDRAPHRERQREPPVVGAQAAARPEVRLDASRLEIRLDGARHWEPRLPPFPRNASRLRRNLARVRAQIAAMQDGASNRALGASTEAVATWGPALSALLLERTRAFCEALARGDPDEACAKGESLLGLGQGLTPSGDDVLVGLFAVLHVPGAPCESVNGVCARIVADADRRTNAISVAALRAAAQGRVRASIQALLAAMMRGSTASVARSLAAVLAIGSTSGRDIAAGIVAAFELQVGQAATTFNFADPRTISMGDSAGGPTEGG